MPQNSNSFKPCDSKPFMRLADDNSNAPILDYNIPQKNCLPLYSGQMINVPIKYFKKEYLNPYIDVFWANLKDKSVANIKKMVVEELQGKTCNFIDNYTLLEQSVLPVVVYDSSSHNGRTVYQSAKGDLANVIAIKGTTKEVKYQTELQNVRDMVSIQDTSTDAKAKRVVQVEQMVKKEVQMVKIPANIAIEFDLNTMVEKFAQGYKAIAVRRATGKVYLEYFLRERKKCLPRFYIKYELMLCSYLGNYGAGDTVSTFSILPGEKTTIAVNTYKHSAYSRSRSENILDSISESSINSLEQAIQTQSGTQTDNTTQQTTVDPGAVHTESTGFLVDLFYHHDWTNENPTDTTTSVNHTSTISSKVESAVSQTVNESNHFREVNVNTSSIQEVEFGEDTSIIRELENINLSRTLNFVFRRLLQRYTTILWLKNVKFGFSSGHLGQQQEVYSQGLQEFINQYILPEHQKIVLQLLLKQVHYIFNYNQEPIQFLECREFKTPKGNCTCSDLALPEEKNCLWLRKKGLVDTYDNITIPGVILNVSEHVLRTPSVIVDALLGQGEALDCYNTSGLSYKNGKEQLALPLWLLRLQNHDCYSLLS